MLSLVAQLIAAARYYFQIKATKADYELTKQIEQDMLEIEQRIAALRARGDPDAQRLADQLRQRLLRAQGVAVAASAARPPAPSGTGSGDEGRSLPPPGG